MTKKDFLESYDSSMYEKPSVTTDILLFTLDEVISEDVKLVSEKKVKVAAYPKKVLS